MKDKFLGVFLGVIGCVAISVPLIAHHGAASLISIEDRSWHWMLEIGDVPELVSLSGGRRREVVSEEHGATRLRIESQSGARLFGHGSSGQLGRARARRGQKLSRLALVRQLTGERFRPVALALILLF